MKKLVLFGNEPYEGYPEVAEAFKRYAWEEAEHALLSCWVLQRLIFEMKD